MSEQQAPAAPLTDEQRDAAAAAKAAEYRESFDQKAGNDNPPAPATEEPVVHEKPEHVPEKFFNKDTGEVNYEAWNKAHAALEAKFHEGSKDGDGESEETPADDKPAADADSSAAILETPAAQNAAKSYAETGAVSDADYDALEKQGISREMVDTYIAGQEAKANVLANAAYEPAGGEERYAEMIQWAAENLDDTSKKAFNNQVQSGDPDLIRSAVTSLADVYGKEATVEGERTGGSPPSNNSSVFNSRAEMSAAINKVGPNGKRLYDTDAAYRNEVMKKIGNSRNRGTVNF